MLILCKSLKKDRASKRPCIFVTHSSNFFLSRFSSFFLVVHFLIFHEFFYLTFLIFLALFIHKIGMVTTMMKMIGHVNTRVKRYKLTRWWKLKVECFLWWSYDDDCGSSSGGWRRCDDIGLQAIMWKNLKNMKNEKLRRTGKTYKKFMCIYVPNAYYMSHHFPFMRMRSIIL